MTRNPAVPRGNGILRDTLNTSREAIDGMLLALATASGRLWRRRLDRTDLGDVLRRPELADIERPRLWGERSVKVAHGSLLITVAISLLMRASLPVFIVPVATYLVFLVAESVNTSLEWLIDTYQAQIGQPHQIEPLVRLIKHVASALVFAINFVGGVTWVVMLLWN